MITIQPEAKSQLLCVRCGHSEDDHNWSTGPCNHKDSIPRSHGGGTVNCICYAFVSPLDSRIAPLIAYHEQTGLSRRTAAALAFVQLRSEGKI